MYVKIINQLNRLITVFVYVTYPIVLLTLIYTRDERLLRALLTPSISFVLVSIFRRYINAPRPYEVSSTVPVIKKDTKGKSFPSRHVFSAFVVATTVYFIYNPLGILLMVIGCILAVLRVLGGVHFPRDVIAGAVIGIISGILGFYL
ncbi:MAG: phosphatase PAP2 family protein [Alkalibacterium sp.]|nr:phosphatase PAP2 family protein [Alkalibacterium sp.]